MEADDDKTMRTLNLLLVEDSEDDADLMLLELRRGDYVADIGPGNTLVLHRAHQSAPCIFAFVVVTGAQHAKQLRDLFFVWAKIDHGDAPSSQNGMSSSISLRRNAAPPGARALLGAPPFVAGFASETARMSMHSFCVGGSVRLSV